MDYKKKYFEELKECLDRIDLNMLDKIIKLGV